MSFNIRGNTLSNLAVMVVVLTAVVCARGQNSSDFSSLEKHVGKEVSVQTSEGQRVTGKLIRAEPSRIVVNQAGTPIPILRESVKTVTRHKNRHTPAWLSINRAIQWCSLPKAKQMEQFIRYSCDHATGKVICQSIERLGRDVTSLDAITLLITLQQQEGRHPGSVMVRTSRRERTIVLVGQDLLTEFHSQEGLKIK